MLTPKQRRFLKAEAHHLKPVVQIGKSGVTDPLVLEIETVLDGLELIKAKLNQNAPDESFAVTELAKKIPDMEHVWTIGRTILLFRPNRTRPTKYPLG